MDWMLAMDNFCARRASNETRQCWPQRGVKTIRAVVLDAGATWCHLSCSRRGWARSSHLHAAASSCKHYKLCHHHCAVRAWEYGWAEDCKWTSSASQCINHVQGTSGQEFRCHPQSQSRSCVACSMAGNRYPFCLATVPLGWGVEGDVQTS